MIVLRVLSLVVATTLLKPAFAVDALISNERRELPLINATRTLDTHSLGPSQSSSTTNLTRTLITPSPVLKSNLSGIFNNASFSICSAIAASRQDRPFRRNAGNELLPDAKGSNAFKRDARNCDIDGITVQLIYFPTSTTNASHPSTLFVSDLNKTFTSPSVYMLWQSITAHDKYFRTTYQFANATKTTSVGSELITCVYSTSTKIRESSTSRIGPILTKVVHPFELSQLSTFDLAGFGMSSVMDYVQFVGSIENPEQDPENPFTYKRMGLTAPSSQLQLSHLYTNCPPTLDKKTPPITRSNGSAVTDEDEDYFSLLNVKNHDHFRCNPFIGIPDFKWLDEPSWKSCSLKFDHRYWGMPDPPHALEFDPGLTPTAPITPPGPGSNPKDPVTTQTPAAPIPVGSPGLASNTAPTTRPYQPVQSTLPPDPKPESQPNNPPRPGNIEHRPVNGGSNDGNNVQTDTKLPPGSLEHHPSDGTTNVNLQKPGDNTTPGNVNDNPSSGGASSGNNAQPSNNKLPGEIENRPSDGIVGTNNGQSGNSGTMGGANGPGKQVPDSQNAKPNPGSNPASNKILPLPGSNEHSPSSGTSGEVNKQESGTKPPSNLANPAENASPSNQDSKSMSGGTPTSNDISLLPGQENPVWAISVAVIGTEVISALPSQNGGKAWDFIVPGGSTIKPGTVTTFPANVPANDPGSKPVIYSVNEAGNLVVSSLNSPTGTIITPPVAPTNPENGLSKITLLTDPNTVIYMGQTLTKGGAIATLSALRAVVTYGPLGVIVQYPNGIASTIPVTRTSIAVIATIRAGADGVGSILVDKGTSGSASLDSASKSSLPGQILEGKSTTTASSKSASSTATVSSAEIKGAAIRNSGCALLYVGMGILYFVKGYY